MNHWHNEFMAEYERQQVLKEMEQVRLEKLTRPAHADRPPLFELIMFNFANWMIAAGKQLRKRYEASNVNQNNSLTDSLPN